MLSTIQVIATILVSLGLREVIGAIVTRLTKKGQGNQDELANIRQGSQEELRQVREELRAEIKVIKEEKANEIAGLKKEISSLRDTVDSRNKEIDGMQKLQAEQDSRFMKQEYLNKTFQDRVATAIEMGNHEALKRIAREVRTIQSQERLGIAPKVPPPNQPWHNDMGKSLNVLLVDDVKDTAQPTAIGLRREGLSVSIAYTGPEALQQIESNEQIGKAFDIILADIMMPGMDGWELCQKIREREATNASPPVTIVLLTGDDTVLTKDKEKMESIGASGCFVKPMNTNDMANRLKEMAL